MYIFSMYRGDVFLNRYDVVDWVQKFAGGDERGILGKMETEGGIGILCVHVFVCLN